MTKQVHRFLWLIHTVYNRHRENPVRRKCFNLQTAKGNCTHSHWKQRACTWEPTLSLVCSWPCCSEARSLQMGWLGKNRPAYSNKNCIESTAIQFQWYPTRATSMQSYNVFLLRRSKVNFISDSLAWGTWALTLLQISYKAHTEHEWGALGGWHQSPFVCCHHCSTLHIKAGAFYCRHNLQKTLSQGY